MSLSKLQQLQELKDPMLKQQRLLIEKIELAKGDPGEDGKTPVKGVDYYTDSEIQAIINYIQSNVTNGKDGYVGKDGRDGYSPIKGVDYFTKDDLARIISDVIYPYASSTATSTLNQLTAAATTTTTIYTPFNGYSDASSTVTTYFTLNGTLVGAYTYQKGNEASTGKLTFLHVNYLGTPVLETDDKGDIVQMDITDIFGNYVMRDQRKDNAYHNKGYTSHEFDDVTGLNYAKARYLDTRMHSFLSVDPMLYKLPQAYLLDPQQMNSYTYARNNPITYTDPTGGYIESALDVGFIAYDLNSLKNNLGQGNYYDAGIDTLALAADGIGLATPFGTGFGLGVRYAGHGGDANKAFGGAKQVINQVKDTVNTSNTLQSVQNTATKLLPAAKDIMVGNAKVTFKNDTISLSEHAVTQMGKRGVTVQQVERTVKNNSPFSYTQQNPRYGPTPSTGYVNSISNLFVGMVKQTNVVTTVIKDVTKNYINNLLKR